MADLQVTCVNVRHHQNPHEGITYLGGKGGWYWTLKQVIDSINGGIHTFYTDVAGKKADVAVVNGRNGPYVRTHADGVWTDNLLALTECKVA